MYSNLKSDEKRRQEVISSLYWSLMQNWNIPQSMQDYFGLTEDYRLYHQLEDSKEPFNLDRMLHRGKYNLDGENKDTEKLTFKNAFRKILGITPEYTKGDKAIAWGFFIYSFVYQFLLVFLLVLVWNSISRWPIEWWSHYFFVVQLVVPGILAFVTTFWFGYGGIKDLIHLFRDLETRKVNHLDNGTVDGHVSLADKAELAAVENAAEAEENK